ncbi:hypothetical protein HV560_07300 [Mannheimia pernigra]|uniref:Uncharacterized protein n=1 Tax=Mannheimia pernigra TaxID=111844 RepID=A0ABD7A950_9PAST|nr:hypothetical protein [Mannheimia pernigra]QLB42636.1 hypothetical protein HV560_07300 [Mannheimia pernigra]
MKILNKFTLTLLSTMILTACSSGGGGSSGNQQKEHVLVPSKNAVAPPAKKAENNIKPKAEKPTIEQPKTEPNPIKPNDKNEKPLTKAAIFNTLSRNGGSFESGQWISLKLDDNGKIQMLPLHKKMIVSSQEVTELFDQSGQFLGYVGYASFTHTKPNINNVGDEIVTHYTFPMLEMDQSQKARPTHNINYEGSFFYYYKNQPVTALKGDVKASYREEDKRLFMELFGKNKEHFELKEKPNEAGVTVSEKGDVFGRLYDNRSANATFNGAIYGKNGEVLAGTLDYDDHNDKDNSWKGTVGAKAKNP